MISLICFLAFGAGSGAVCQYLLLRGIHSAFKEMKDLGSDLELAQETASISHSNALWHARCAQYWLTVARSNLTENAYLAAAASEPRRRDFR